MLLTFVQVGTNVRLELTELDVLVVQDHLPKIFPEVSILHSVDRQLFFRNKANQDAVGCYIFMRNCYAGNVFVWIY